MKQPPSGAAEKKATTYGIPKFWNFRLNGSYFRKFSYHFFYERSEIFALKGKASTVRYLRPIILPANCKPTY